MTFIGVGFLTRTENAELALKPVNRESVVDNVLRQLRHAISVGRFRRGDRLPSEFELMEELKVSRNSLREAMKILETIGIVEIRRGDGTYICKEIKPSLIDSVAYSVLLEESSAEELIEFRQTLDEDMLRLAVRKGTEEDIQILQELTDRMREYLSRGEIGAASSADVQFHRYLAKCTRNPFLERMLLGIYDLFERSIERNIQLEESFASADQHHQAMVDCIANHDESRVTEVIAQSLSSWRKDIKAKISN